MSAAAEGLFTGALGLRLVLVVFLGCTIGALLSRRDWPLAIVAVALATALVITELT
ncbi:MAG: hypothetical protein ACRDYV_00045 [Acidimicrobiia bacterium]